ncbi:expressed unknown protein [Seminavis robusta]|uniref:Uncharacterized protein n=1 Tax=Seminavis robusta TaxID=568900 RepID=A0A9N8DK80_9STRA|nr:expressed unknown protein [Seminavis robusta]|eukprot:Sro200_g084630.1 n/a (460) ;mRNA; f:26832-28211
MTVEIKALVNAGSWNEVRKRIKRWKKKERIGELLVFCTVKDTPDDITEELLSKLEPGEGSRGFVGSSMPGFGVHFWYAVRGDCTAVHEKSKESEFLDFGMLCNYARVSPLRLVVNRYLQTQCKPLYSKVVWKALRFTWLNSNSNHWKMDGLLQIESIEDLESDKCKDLRNLWQKTELLFRASQEKHGMSKPLHEMSFIHMLIQEGMPKISVWLALRLLPASQLLQVDSHGRTPLHIAAMCNETELEKDDPMFSCNYPGCLLKDSTILEMVLKACPEAASKPDKEGSLPLSLLLQQTGNFVAYSNGLKKKEHMLRSVHAFVVHAPHALALPNPKDKMLPFMLAATSPKDIDVTFSILIESPSVVVSGIEATDREVWLTDKLKQAQTHNQKLEDENQKLRALLAKQEPTLPPRVAPLQIYNLPSIKYPSRKRHNSAVAASRDPAAKNGCSDRPPKSRRLDP